MTTSQGESTKTDVQPTDSQAIRIEQVFEYLMKRKVVKYGCSRTDDACGDNIKDIKNGQ